MVQESELYTSINHWKLSSPLKSECIIKQDNNNNSNHHVMHTQIGHHISEPTYSTEMHPYSVSVPCVINQKPFSYVNDSPIGLNTSLNHITQPVPQQPYPSISMMSYQVDSGQYVSAGVNNVHQQPLLHPSAPNAIDSNVSNDSELDTNGGSVKKRRKPAPTIATGRRNLKNEVVAPDEAERRVKRRERNRKSAQRCRERKIEKKDSLQKEINEIKEKIRKYLDLAENIILAWKGRLRFIDENLPANSFKSHLSVFEFEQLIESYICRNSAISEPERGDNGSPQSSVADPHVKGSVKHEYLMGGPPPILTTHSNNNNSSSCNNNNSIMSCVKVDQFYQTSFNSDLLPPNIVNSSYDQYQHPFANGNDIEYI